jgi:hypothetical protein
MGGGGSADANIHDKAFLKRVRKQKNNYIHKAPSIKSVAIKTKTHYHLVTKGLATRSGGFGGQLVTYALNAFE